MYFFKIKIVEIKNDFIFAMLYCESSSVGRALAFQAKCRRFEPGLSLKNVAIATFFFAINFSVYFQKPIVE